MKDIILKRLDEDKDNMSHSDYLKLKSDIENDLLTYSMYLQNRDKYLIKNNSQTVSNPQREETETSEDIYINEYLKWLRAETDTLEDIEGETITPTYERTDFKVLLSLELLKDKDINYNVYAVLKTLTNYVGMDDRDFISDIYDTVDMAKFKLKDIAKLIMSPREDLKKEGAEKGMTTKLLSRELELLDSKGYIILNKEPVYNKDKTKIMRYKNISIDIPKVQKGEKAIMLNSETIKNLSSVLNSDSLKIYLWLLSKYRHFKANKRDFITTTKGIYEGVYQEPIQTGYDSKKLQRIIKGLYSIHLIDYNYAFKTDAEGNTYKLYWITEVKEPRTEEIERIKKN